MSVVHRTLIQTSRIPHRQANEASMCAGASMSQEQFAVWVQESLDELALTERRLRERAALEAMRHSALTPPAPQRPVLASGGAVVPA